MSVFMTPWLPNIVSFVAGSAVTAIVAILIYRKQRRDAAPGIRMLTDVHRKMQSGAMTTDEAAREIIKGLETGALNPGDLQAWEWTYKFCPECKGPVEVTGSWSADEYNAFGGTMKCKKPGCGWTREFSN
jgi:hypothetical protein